ncbi:MAG: hypothetical protein JWO92_1691 [Chitinophagaceae bacterium]|nr:hypothetical protein [Chitinophagaceae bacterium]MDB5223728.1 hypothetical protein [Chitinophagaceae bacterium]
MFNFELSEKQKERIFFYTSFYLLSLKSMPTKIQLSPQEMELVKNTNWILSKHVITKKVYDMFGEISVLLKSETESYNYLFPENMQYQSGKISKGENYQLLPYVILDYPAFFWKDRIFAVRTMFWWGNFFSVTLHLSGDYKQKFINNSHALFSFLQKNNFFVCINENEWQHHFEKDNYIPSSTITLQQFETINEKNFFKISKKIPLAEWQHANQFIINSFREIMQLLQISCPAGKKDLLPGSPKAGSGL